MATVIDLSRATWGQVDAILSRALALQAQGADPLDALEQEARAAIAADAYHMADHSFIGRMQEPAVEYSEQELQELAEWEARRPRPRNRRERVSEAQMAYNEACRPANSVALSLV